MGAEERSLADQRFVFKASNPASPTGWHKVKPRQRYGEPAWSYQVVRFLDADGRDIIPRKDHVWEASPLAARMIATLEKAGRPVRQYLKTVASENPAHPK